MVGIYQQQPELIQFTPCQKTAELNNHVGSSTTGGENSRFVIYHGHRNLVWTYIKNMPGIFFWLYLPHHCFLNMCNILVLVFRGKRGMILRAKYDAIKGIPLMWRKRALIQAKKRCKPPMS
jgi:hypothetical protein